MSVCVCVLVCVALVSSMQCACAILSSVVCPALHFFYTVSQKGTISEIRKFIEHKMCVLNFSTIFV